ncbi:MAG: oligosaccharide flippase family protein [Anaerolineales bacterium]|nr:oligosaccharide flippase family protein [Anaerolineales bacterium]
MLRWLGLTFMFNAAGSVHNVLLQRELNFRKKIFPDLGHTVVKAAISGFGVWSLVIGQLAGTIIQSIILWVVLPWRPKLIWNASIAKRTFPVWLFHHGE